MENKLHCPHCGRCIGICSSNDETAVSKVLCVKPKRLKKKQMVQGLKCIKCKSIVYVSLEFIE